MTQPRQHLTRRLNGFTIMSTMVFMLICQLLYVGVLQLTQHQRLAYQTNIWYSQAEMQLSRARKLLIHDIVHTNRSTAELTGAVETSLSANITAQTTKLLNHFNVIEMIHQTPQLTVAEIQHPLEEDATTTQTLVIEHELYVRLNKPTLNEFRDVLTFNKLHIYGHLTQDNHFILTQISPNMIESRAQLTQENMRLTTLSTRSVQGTFTTNTLNTSHYSYNTGEVVVTYRNSEYTLTSQVGHYFSRRLSLPALSLTYLIRSHVYLVDSNT